MTEVPCADGPPGGLATPTRNKYFYGKLLDVFHLDLEQAYGNRKRWLVNRLVLGSGVVCGLEVAGTAAGMVQVAPGVALDRHGREIVVPAASPVIDPRQPTDDCGRPTGPPVGDGTTVTVYLAYHECGADYVPATACDCGCDGEPCCQASTVRERYRVLVVPGTTAAPSPQCTMPGLWQTGTSSASLRLPGTYGSLDYPVLSAHVGAACPEVAGDGRIPLATVTVHGSGAQPPATVDVDLGVRPVVTSNEVLLEAMVCLLDTVAGTGALAAPPPAPPRITSYSPWTHAGTLPVDILQSEGLQVTFDRPVQWPHGPSAGWFLVELEFGATGADPTERSVRRVEPREPLLSDDRQTVFFPLSASLREWVAQAGPDAEVLCRVVLKCHVLVDDDGTAVDGDFLGGVLPTGDGVPGGDFDSWFTVTGPEQ